MTSKSLALMIKEECDKNGIMYDVSDLPIKIGPDCYIFHAVPKSEECVGSGHCRQLPYYAYVGKEGLSIMYTKTMCD